MNHAIQRVALAVALIFGFAAAHSIAATFRVTTRIYEGASVESAAVHEILFDEGLVYDLPQINNRFVTVFDAAQKRVTILDRKTQVRTTLGTDQLIKVSAQARAAAKTPEQQERLGLMAKIETSNRGGYVIRFGSFEYFTSTQSPGDTSMAADYGRFADLAARLNIVRHLGPPPFGRMTLNQYVMSKGELPLETTLTVRRGENVQRFRATHALAELTDADRKRIHEVQGMLMLYREVTLKEFPNE